MIYMPPRGEANPFLCLQVNVLERGKLRRRREKNKKKKNKFLLFLHLYQSFPTLLSTNFLSFPSSSTEASFPSFCQKHLNL